MYSGMLLRIPLYCSPEPMDQGLRMSRLPAVAAGTTAVGARDISHPHRILGSEHFTTICLHVLMHLF